MVFDIEPVAHVRALAVDGQRLALERIDDHQRDQLLGKMIGAVIVRAIADDGRQPVGVMPRVDQMIRRGLRGGIGRASGRRRWFRGSCRSSPSEPNTSSVEMWWKRKRPPLRLGQARANGRAPPRSSVYVPTTLVGMNSPGPSMERSTWLSAARCITTSGRNSASAARIGGAVADVGSDEAVARARRDRRQAVEVARIGELVDNEHVVAGADEVAHHG